ncbi:hypothetical protein [Arcobacter sp. FWKO B]|uniref:hypothetical protein n=1 Tax=Arcobacter sp. FWKO B TaxID=2593672 RepID=UPI0018A407D4|nr:hypothetical protein [Arcobacter sp. FWKO B]QOG11376.1 hypothetical protein FWKOB_01100 [Arcobacter sp. FWKO B]
MLSLLDTANLYISFGVCYGDFKKLSSTIDGMSPSVVEYFLSSLIISYNEHQEDINFSEYITVGDYTIYNSYSEELYLKTVLSNTTDDERYETPSLF